MRTGLTLAIMALTALVVAAVAYRVFHRAGPRPPDSLPARALPAITTPLPPVAYSAPATSAPPPEPVGDALARLAGLIRRARELERPPPFPGEDVPDDPAAGIRVEAETEGRRLADRLRADPAEWFALIDGLAALEDDAAAVQIAAMAAPGLEEESERNLSDVLDRDDRPRARRAAVSALAGRGSPQSLAALVRASSADPDTDLRLRALKALSDRRLRSRDPGTIRAVEEALSRSAAADPDLRVRQAAARLRRIDRTTSTPPPSRVQQGLAPTQPSALPQ